MGGVDSTVWKNYMPVQKNQRKLEPNLLTSRSLHLQFFYNLQE